MCERERERESTSRGEGQRERREPDANLIPGPQIMTRAEGRCLTD